MRLHSETICACLLSFECEWFPAVAVMTSDCRAIVWALIPARRNMPKYWHRNQLRCAGHNACAPGVRAQTTSNAELWARFKRKAIVPK